MLLNQLLFFVSVLISVITIFYLLKSLGLKKEYFFSFFPILFLYLGFISTILSIFQRLTYINFLILQFIFFGISWIIFLRSKIKTKKNNLFRWVKKENRFSFNGDKFAYILFVFVILLIISSFCLRKIFPVYNIDDSGYRASTPLYWVQNQSIFRFETANERKNVFAMGSGLIYMWPNLFFVGEQIANVFYWLGFPLTIVGIYLFTGLFTKNNKIKIIISLIFVSTPIVMDQYTSSLIQELWLGIALLSYYFFIIKEIRTQKLDKYNGVLLGLSVGMMLFIKPTSAVHLLAILIIILDIKNKGIVYLKWLFLGSGCFLFFSGYLLLLIQNFNLYNNPFGSKMFRQDHLADISFLTIKTEMVRFPFSLIEFPTFSYKIAKNIESPLRSFSQSLGATTVLDKEAEENWLGVYQFQLPVLNQHFSIGGLLWLILLIIAIIDFFKFIFLKNQKFKNNKENILFFLLFISTLAQTIFIRWAEGSFVPYRHLLSTFAVVCGFYPLYLIRIRRFTGEIVYLTLLAILIVSSIQLFLVNMESINFWQSKTAISYNFERNAFRNSYYNDFLKKISNSKPINYLLIEEQSVRDYPLFLQNGVNKNKVYLTSLKNEENIAEFVQIMTDKIKKNNIDYVVLYAQSDQLYDALKKMTSVLTLMFHTTQNDQSLIIFKTK